MTNDEIRKTAIKIYYVCRSANLDHRKSLDAVIEFLITVGSVAKVDASVDAEKVLDEPVKAEN